MSHYSFSPVHYIGKREAEAAPEAKPDPFFFPFFGWGGRRYGGYGGGWGGWGRRRYGWW